MINRDDLLPEDRAIYDASFIGAIDRLDHEWVNLKRAVYDALPRSIQWLFIWLIEQ